MDLDIKLSLGAVKKMYGLGDRRTMRTTDASVGEVIEPQSIRELPLTGAC